MHYLPDGQLDPSFGNGGKVFTSIGPGTNTDEALSAVLDASGRIIVAGFARFGTGSAGSDFALARYLPDGTLDSAFNPGGTRPGIIVIDIAGNRDQFNDVTIDASARIVAAGSARVGGDPIEVRVVVQDLVDRHARGKELRQILDRLAQPADGQLTVTYRGVRRHPSQ